jgi:hypothetical protein
MPTYNFINNDTGEEYSEFMSMSDLDEYLKSNPNVVQLVNDAPALVSGVSQKPDQGFRDLLKDMKKNNSKGFQKSSINTF